MAKQALSHGSAPFHDSSAFPSARRGDGMRWRPCPGVVGASRIWRCDRSSSLAQECRTSRRGRTEEMVRRGVRTLRPTSPAGPALSFGRPPKRPTGTTTWTPHGRTVFRPPFSPVIREPRDSSPRRRLLPMEYWPHEPTRTPENRVVSVGVVVVPGGGTAPRRIAVPAAATQHAAIPIWRAKRIRHRVLRVLAVAIVVPLHQGV